MRETQFSSSMMKAGSSYSTDRTLLGVALSDQRASGTSGAEGTIGHAVVRHVAEDKVGLAWSVMLY